METKLAYVIIVNQIDFDKIKYIEIFSLNIIITFNTARLSLFKLKSCKN